ncbi:MAG: S1/P1 nuclease [Bacteroidota bacterium]|nr:S1/P1 nuclease [Bacteroidota bacterium]MDP4234288.1 S1/P1 nuclease [Bacteroidota bacterium]MDP4243223.1 S1/P1 nuclease [Bacteroidota bacterium]MDP4288071.1 S1/P1 nuclease [Bacteroidota bacterium]
MKRLLILCLTCLPLLAPASSFAWGREGHEVVVRMALRLMKRSEQVKVYELLGTHDWGEIGRWADSIRPHRPESEDRWHYVDIPATADAYDAARDCEPTCIIKELEHARATVQNKNALRAERKEALLFWLHLVGDLYQPFHCYNNNDRGANTLVVIYHGHKRKMHQLWDATIIKDKNPSARSLASKIYRTHHYPASLPSLVEAANVSHARALEALLKPGEKMNSKYLRHEWTVITRSLWEAACLAAEIGADI